MLSAAENLEFERAAGLRDKILRMREKIGQLIESDGDDDRMVGGRQRKRSSKGTNSRIPGRKRND